MSKICRILQYKQTTNKMAKTQKQIDEFFKTKQEQLETLQPRSQMILNDEPLWPTGKEIEEYDPFAKMKSKLASL